MFNYTPQNVPANELEPINGKELKGFGGNKYYELKDRYGRVHRQYVNALGEDSFRQPTTEFLKKD